MPRFLKYALLLLTFVGGSAIAQQAKHALLIGISQYPAPWGKLNGSEDVKQLEANLNRQGFQPFNVKVLTESKATHGNIQLEFRKLKEKIQPGDMVYVHFSGHFQRVVDQNKDEEDGLDEAFIPIDALPQTTATYQGENHLLDEQIGGLMRQLLEKLTSAGFLYVSFDGGFSNNPGPGMRGTQQVFGNEASPNPDAEGYDNELCDQRFDPNYSLSIFEACSDCESLPEVKVEGKNLGSLTAALLELLESGKRNVRIRDVEKQLKTIGAKKGLALPKTDASNKSVAFFALNETTEVDFDLSELVDKKDGKVFGIIIGVSNYLEAPRLKYANTDAYKFYRMLKHSFGKRMVTDSNFVFLDMNATIKPIERALRSTVNQVAEGDRVYIYFAGHGDVEESVTRRGHLLLYDTPSHVYEEGSTLRVDRLKEYVMEYVSRKAQVFLVMDACHAGKLAGGDEGKGQNLLAIKEVSTHTSRLLSCQPNEKSLESDKYGGGSGIFTFYLIEGLSGKANEDNNEVLTLNEMKKYLGQSVSNATDLKQNPIVEGNSRLTFMPMAKKASFITDIKQSEVELLASRNIIPLSSAKKDSLKNRLQAEFFGHLKKGNLVKPEQRCAKSSFEKMESIFTSDFTTMSVLKNALVDALATKTQRLVNNYIEAAEGYSNEDLFALASEETNYLQKLVGYKDNSYFQYEARKLFFQSRAISPTEVDNDLNRNKAFDAIANLKKANRIEPGKANIHNALGRLYFYVKAYDSALVHLRVAHQLAPNWKYPINNLGATFEEFSIAKKSKSLSDSAIWHYNRVLTLYPDYALAWKNLGKTYENRAKLSEAKNAYKKSIFLKPDLPQPYINLGTLYLEEQKWDSASFYFSSGIARNSNHPDLLSAYGGMFYEQARKSNTGKRELLNRSISLLTKSYSLDSGIVITLENLSNAYWEKARYDSAAIYYAKCVLTDTMNTDYREYEIESLLKAKKYTEALSRAKANQIRFPDLGAFYFHEGLVLATKEKHKEAADLLKKGMLKGYIYNTDIIETDANLKAFTASPHFKAIKPLVYKK